MMIYGTTGRRKRPFSVAARSSLLLFLLLEKARHRRLVLLRGKAAAAARDDFETSAFRVLFSRDNKKRTTRRLIVLRVISLSFSFDDAKKDHPSLCFVLFRSSLFAHTLTTSSSLTSSKKTLDLERFLTRRRNRRRSTLATSPRSRNAEREKYPPRAQT
jgi:hypothetical protein